MLLLWLSIVCMIPFDMCRLDSNIKGEGDNTSVRKPVMDRIIEAGKVKLYGFIQYLAFTEGLNDFAHYFFVLMLQLYLDVTDKTRDASAFMLSKFMTRPDVKREKLPEFLDWAIISMKNSDSKALGLQYYYSRMHSTTLFFLILLRV